MWSTLYFISPNYLSTEAFSSVSFSRLRLVESLRVRRLRGRVVNVDALLPGSTFLTTSVVLRLAVCRTSRGANASDPSSAANQEATRRDKSGGAGLLSSESPTSMAPLSLCPPCHRPPPRAATPPLCRLAPIDMLILLSTTNSRLCLWKRQ